MSCKRRRKVKIDTEGKNIQLQMIRLFKKAPHIYIGPQQ